MTSFIILLKIAKICKAGYVTLRFSDFQSRVASNPNKDVT